MHTFFSRTFVIAAMLALVACGGGGDSGSSFENPPGQGNTPPPGVTPAALTAMSSATSMPSDGSSTAEITALVRDASNQLVPGVAVSFTASSGGIAVTQGTTDSAGAARATLTTAGDSSLRTITVTATAGSMNATVNVQVVAAAGGTSVQMGSLVGTTFTPNAINISSGTLSAGGSTGLQVALQSSDGTLFSQAASVAFSSPCIAQGLATVTSPVNTSSGIANATYAAQGCSGTDVITATATVGGTPLSATGSVTVASASIGSIVFESASVSNIALRGTGSTQNPESSIVVFRVLDQSNGPRANATVNFTLNTTVGGIALTPASATTDATGRVQTVVQGGTVNTTVRVTATVTSTTPTISTQSNLLTVTTGIPDQDSFSLAVSCANVEALTRNNVPVTVTAQLSDRFNNPVPAGTAVTFTTEGGSIQSQCATGLVAGTTSPNGLCSVTWTSSNPRPPSAGAPDRPGRSTILATAIGEETFGDGNGNGSFDNGETFDDQPERFLDANEDNTYQVGETIYDFNNNSTRDNADGLFNGVLCNDTSGRCDATAPSTGIGAETLIIMSGSTPVITDVDGDPLPLSFNVTAGTSTPLAFRFADVNDNPLPSGTTITAQIAGTGYTLGDPSAFTVPCTTEPTNYTFTVNAEPTAAAGTLTLRIRVPSNLETIVQYGLQ